MPPRGHRAESGDFGVLVSGGSSNAAAHLQCTGQPLAAKKRQPTMPARLGLGNPHLHPLPSVHSQGPSPSPPAEGEFNRLPMASRCPYDTSGTPAAVDKARQDPARPPSEPHFQPLPGTQRSFLRGGLHPCCSRTPVLPSPIFPSVRGWTASSPNPYVEAPTPSPSECDSIQRQGLSRGG